MLLTFHCDVTIHKNLILLNPLFAFAIFIFWNHKSLLVTTYYQYNEYKFTGLANIKWFTCHPILMNWYLFLLFKALQWRIVWGKLPGNQILYKYILPEHYSKQTLISFNLHHAKCKVFAAVHLISGIFYMHSAPYKSDPPMYGYSRSL